MVSEVKLLFAFCCVQLLDTEQCANCDVKAEECGNAYDDAEQQHGSTSHCIIYNYVLENYSNF